MGRGIRTMTIRLRSMSAALIATILSIAGLATAPASAGTIVGFDFENATAGDSTAAASAVGGWHIRVHASARSSEAVHSAPAPLGACFVPDGGFRMELAG